MAERYPDDTLIESLIKEYGTVEAKIEDAPEEEEEEEIPQLVPIQRASPRKG